MEEFNVDGGEPVYGNAVVDFNIDTGSKEADTSNVRKRVINSGESEISGPINS